MRNEPDVQRSGREDEEGGYGAPAPGRRVHLPSLADRQYTRFAASMRCTSRSQMLAAKRVALRPRRCGRYTAAVKSSTSFAMTSCVSAKVAGSRFDAGSVDAAKRVSVA